MIPFLSIVIPSYNEMKNIKRGVLNDVLQFLSDQPYTWEVVLSDDGSTDGTLEKLRRFAQDNEQVRLLENYHAGKGPTVTSGMLAARGEYRLFTDFDQSTPLYEVNAALSLIQKGAQIVIGTREGDGSARRKEPLHRHIMGRGFNMLVQLLALRGISDSQCGFKLFSAAATVELFSSMVVYGDQAERKDAYTGAFDVELLFLARKRKIDVAQLPVQWAHVQSDRVSPLKDSLRMLRDIIRIRIAWVLGKYNG